MESQHSKGVPTCHDLPRFVIISEKSRLEVGNRWRWSRFCGEFSKNYSERIHHVTESRLVCKFREIWLTGNPESRALFTWQKNKTSARYPALASARIAPKICQGQLQTIYSEFPKFHPNPFTSSGVIAERVNIIETCHKVFPILGEASSPSNECYWCDWAVRHSAVRANYAYMLQLKDRIRFTHDGKQIRRHAEFWMVRFSSVIKEELSSSWHERQWPQ